MFDYNSVSRAFETVFRAKKDVFGANESDFVKIHGRERDGSSDVSVGMLDFERSHIELVYISSAPMYAQRSMLECRIYPDKRDTSLFFSPYELMYDVFNGYRATWLFPYIESAERMEKCAEYMMDELLPLIDDIEALSNDHVKCFEIYEKKRRAIEEFFKNDSEKHPEDANSLEVFAFKITYYDGWICRLISTSDFKKLLEGETPRSFSTIANDSANPDFFAKLYSENATNSAQPIKTQNELDTLSLCMNVQNSPKEFFYLLIALISFLPIFAASYALLYGVLKNMAFKNVFALFPIDPSNTIFLISFLSSAVVAYFTRRPIIFLFARDKKRRLAYFDMLCSGGVRKTVKVLSHFVIILCIILTAFISCRNYAFYEDGFTDNSKMFSVPGDHYSYREIESVSFSENSVRITILSGESFFIPAESESKERAVLEKLLTDHGIEKTDLTDKKS